MPYSVWRWALSNQSFISRISGRAKQILPEKPARIYTSNSIPLICTSAISTENGLIRLPHQPTSLPPCDQTKTSPALTKLVASPTGVLAVGLTGELWEVDWTDKSETNNPIALTPDNLVTIPGLVVDAAAGDDHMLAVTDDGTVWARGNGQYGRLGTGDHKNEDDFVPLEFFSSRPVLSKGRVTRVGCGSAFSAALTDTGVLFLWGLNDAGQLGQGEAGGDFYSSKRYPVTVPYFDREKTKIVDFACGEKHVVAVSENGVVYYWGAGDWVEPRPLTIPSIFEAGIKNIKGLTAGSQFSFLFNRDGKLWYKGKVDSELFPKNASFGQVDPFDSENVQDITCSHSECIAVTTSA